MTTRNLVFTGLLLLVSVATMAAQNSLPNPQDDSCWSSLSALRACQVQAYDEAQAHAQSCTSYPEYQCFDYYQAPQKTAKAAVKANSRQSESAPVAAGVPVVAPDNVQTGAAN